MGRRRNQSSTSSTALMPLNLNSNNNAMVQLTNAASGPTLKQLVTALDLDISDTVIDICTNSDSNKKGTRDRLRQKFARKTVVQYATAVQKVRKCSKQIQHCRDQILRAEADLVMINLRRQALLWNESVKECGEDEEVKQSHVKDNVNGEATTNEDEGDLSSNSKIGDATGVNTGKGQSRSSKPKLSISTDQSTVEEVPECPPIRSAKQHSPTSVTTTVFDFANVKITSDNNNKHETHQEGLEGDTELETLSDDSWNTASIPESLSLSEDQEDGNSANAAMQDNKQEDPTTSEDGFTSSIYEHVASFFDTETGRPNLIVGNGKDIKRIKKAMIKSLLHQPELQRVMQASPLLRELKDIYMEKAKSEDGSPHCTKSKGCRCEIHKDAHEAMVETMVNSFVNHFVGIQTAGGQSPFHHQIAQEEKKKASQQQAIEN